MKKLLLVLLLSFLLSGCFPGLGSGGGGQTLKPGEFSKGKAVVGFPNLPLYPEAKIVESYGTEESYGASAYIEEDIAKVVQFYDESLPLLGWESNLVQNPLNYTFEVKDQTNKGWVIINKAADGKSTAITLSSTPR